MQTPGPEISLHVSVARQEMDVLRRDGQRAAPLPGVHLALRPRQRAGQSAHAAGALPRGAKNSATARTLGAVFKSRLPTGENGLGATDDDLVLTRILWLEGDEEHNANTRDRYIYIHGTNHEAAIGQPASHGCVRMRNADVAELYDLTPPGTVVTITRRRRPLPGQTP